MKLAFGMDADLTAKIVGWSTCGGLLFFAGRTLILSAKKALLGDSNEPTKQLIGATTKKVVVGMGHLASFAIFLFVAATVVLVVWKVVWMIVAWAWS